MTVRRLHLAAVAGLVMLVAACGGSTATASPTGASTPPSSAVSPSAAAPSAPAESAAPSEAAASPGIPNLSEIFGSAKTLDSLTSYKMSIEIVGKDGTTQVTQTSIRKPSVAARYDVKTGQGQTYVVVRIGSDAWVSQDGTTFIKTPTAAVSALIDVFTPEAMFGAFEKQEAFKALTNVGTETKNGVQATHYHIDSSTPLPSGVTQTIPPGASGDVWVADEGYLVAVEATGFGSAGASDTESITLEVTNINDPALKVERPQ